MATIVKDELRMLNKMNDLLIVHDLVRVHRNMDKGEWKIDRLNYDGTAFKAGWDKVFLKNVYFIVNQELRSKQLKSGMRNLHAAAYGELLSEQSFWKQWEEENERDPKHLIRIYYNPNYVENFINIDTKEVVKNVKLAMFNNLGMVYALI